MFAENEELPAFEILVYYFQHAWIAGIASFILYRKGRYSPFQYSRQPLPYFGFILFVIYMRYFLTPLGALTWANLNHTLCGIENDPWREYFGMHKYFFFWADFYLAFTSHLFNYLVAFLGYMFLYLSK